MTLNDARGVTPLASKVGEGALNHIRSWEGRETPRTQGCRHLDHSTVRPTWDFERQGDPQVPPEGSSIFPILSACPSFLWETLSQEI